jgi:hypothetical protein
MELLIMYLTTAEPRKVPIKSASKNVILYTDGAVEGKLTTCGGIIFVPGEVPEFFGMEVPGEWTDSWAGLGIKHAVAQAEAYPVLVAKLTWRKKLQGRNVLLFTDNEGIKAALIKGFSGNYATMDLLNAIGAADAASDVVQWVARVPSKSNPADLPSRLEFAAAKDQFGAVEISPVLPVLGVGGRALIAADVLKL